MVSGDAKRPRSPHKHISCQDLQGAAEPCAVLGALPAPVPRRLHSNSGATRRGGATRGYAEEPSLALWRLRQITTDLGNGCATKLNNRSGSHLARSTGMPAHIIHEGPTDNFFLGYGVPGGERSACLFRQGDEGLPLVLRPGFLKCESVFCNDGLQAPGRHSFR